MNFIVILKEIIFDNYFFFNLVTSCFNKFFFFFDSCPKKTENGAFDAEDDEVHQKSIP